MSTASATSTASAARTLARQHGIEWKAVCIQREGTILSHCQLWLLTQPLELLNHCHEWDANPHQQRTCILESLAVIAQVDMLAGAWVRMALDSPSSLYVRVTVVCSRQASFSAGPQGFPATPMGYAEVAPIAEPAAAPIVPANPTVSQRNPCEGRVRICPGLRCVLDRTKQERCSRFVKECR